MKKILLFAALFAGAAMVSQAQSFSFSIGHQHRGYYAPAPRYCPPAYSYHRNDHREYHRDLRAAHQDVHRDLRHQKYHGASRSELKAAHKQAHRDLKQAHRHYHHHSHGW